MYYIYKYSAFLVTCVACPDLSGATELSPSRLRPAFVTELGPTELGPFELGPTELGPVLSFKS